ncbi:vesicle-associated membrane protein 8-like isoform X2 [Stegastes partitus]|uniref:Vesicle-associated membrane protein 8-like isoform X2 n=1 Tax=Stegastes partitus TaxID=144197 RepID=A0A9Y4K4H1_9TELE|nr:PREDICTED: vesicle-associated membrane protein 8-like isoform X2 [Stegastes partitus]
MKQEGLSAEPVPRDKLSVINDEVDKVSKIMKSNVEKMLDHQLKAENLLTISEELTIASQNLDRTTKQVEKSYRGKNVKLIIFIVVIVLVIVLIVVLLATGVIPVSAPLPPVVTNTTKP